MSRARACGCLIGGVAVAFAVTTAMAGVSASGSATIDVATGETKGPGEAVVAGEGTLVKTGGGTLELGASDLFRPGALKVSVAEGSVVLKAAAVLAPADLSATVKAKLTLWLSAKSISSGEGDLTRWYDVRETNTESPTYPYAEADTSISGGVRPVYSAACKYVRGEVTNTMAAVSFKGYGSGVRMSLFWPNGTKFGDNDGAKSYPRAAFAVYGLNYGKRFGTLFGSTHPTEYPILAGGETRWSYFWPQPWGPLSGIICRLDGNRIDGRYEDAAEGFHLLEVTPNPYPRDGWAIPYGLMSCGQSKGTNGGDYISEVLWFTKPLTEDERLEVERYLAAKWFGKTGTRQVTLAQDATMTVQTGSAGDGTSVPFAATGAGAVNLAGEGTLVIGTEANDLGDAAPITLKNQAIVANRSLPTLAVEAGTRLAATAHTNGTLIAATSDAGAGRVVKEGFGATRLSGLDADTTRLEVNAGVLSITPPLASKTFDADHAEVYIPDAGFETNALASASSYEKGAFAFGNWGLKNWIGGEMAFWYDYDKWTEVGGSASIGASISAWGFNTIRPPEGNCAVAMKRDATLTSTAFTVASAGTYEFSLMMWGRGEGPYGFGLKVELLNEGGTVIDTLGVMRYFDVSAFRKKVLATQIPAAGKYKLRLSGYYTYKSPIPDITVVIDDLHLYRTGPLDTATWKIPNGDFELANIPSQKDGTLAAFTNGFVAEGWTLANPAGWTTVKPAVGLATPFTQAIGSRRGYNAFDNSRDPRGGSVCVLFRTNATISTTFTPPAGTRYLAANLANWGTGSRKSVPFDATITIGGTTVNLGRVYTSSSELRRAVWPVPFTANGETEATLTVSFAGNGGLDSVGALADDFTFTTDYDETRELVQNGGFETNDAWTKDVGKTEPTYRTYTYDLVNFGLDFIEGLRFADYNGPAAIRQSITFPKAGTYRLSLFVHNRKKGWVYNPLRAELVSGGVTNAILTVSDAPYRWTRYETTFSIAEAGAHALQLRSLNKSSYVCIDDVSVKYLADAETRKATLDPSLDVRVAQKATLVLDFDGEAKVGRVRLGGKIVTGRIDAATYPDYIGGTGALVAEPRGFMLIVK